MRQIRFISASVTLLMVAASLSAETLVDDKFTSAEQPKRQLMRGPWKIADGAATCTQDDALYAKDKEHGPIIWYDVTFTDGTVKFALKPQQTKTFVFSVNDDKGHVFRFVITPTRLSVFAWPEQGHDAKAVALLAPKPGAPVLKDGEWLEATLKFEGKRCSLKLGDFEQAFEHEAIAKNKTKLGLGFSFGTLSVRDVTVTSP